MKQLSSILLEAAAVLITTVVLAFVANAVYSDGLTLVGRNYFVVESKLPVDTQPPPSGGDVDGGSGDTPTESLEADDPATAAVVERLREKGIRVKSHDGVAKLYESPEYADGAYAFVDARNDDHYRAGHIPGAYQFDHFHMERYIPHVVPACQAAIEVVVYCYGKDCTDSEITAQHLINLGVDPTMLSVYVGGIQTWCEKGMPIEKGERSSGDTGECDG